jgi:hypothetical protein
MFDNLHVHVLCVISFNAALKISYSKFQPDLKLSGGNLKRLCTHCLLDQIVRIIFVLKNIVKNHHVPSMDAT